jgi:hypothetical protein
MVLAGSWVVTAIRGVEARRAALKAVVNGSLEG